MILLYERGPIQDLSEAHLRSREMCGSVPQQEQGVEVWRGQENRLSIDLDRLLPYRRELFQARLDSLAGWMGMDIHEVIMILEKLAFEMEGRVVVGMIHPYSEFFLKHPIRTLVLPEVPEVHVPAGAMHGDRIIQAQAIHTPSAPSSGSRAGHRPTPDGQWLLGK